MGGKKKKFGKPSTDTQKAGYLANKGGVWDKQCIDCRWIYVKFHKECPECGSSAWDLVNHIDDPDFAPAFSEIPYTPTPEEIREKCEIIRADWDDKRIATQERRREWFAPIVCAQKNPDGDLLPSG